jgi:hypothetical protein
MVWCMVGTKKGAEMLSCLRSYHRSRVSRHPERRRMRAVRSTSARMDGGHEGVSIRYRGRCSKMVHLVSVAGSEGAGEYEEMHTSQATEMIDDRYVQEYLDCHRHNSLGGLRA